MKKAVLIAALCVVMFFTGRRSVSFTHVPEINLQFHQPPAFSSIGLCVGCTFEPWQTEDIGLNLSEGKPLTHWNVHNILVRVEDDGGEISCNNEGAHETSLLRRRN